MTTPTPQTDLPPETRERECRAEMAQVLARHRCFMDARAVFPDTIDGRVAAWLVLRVLDLWRVPMQPVAFPVAVERRVPDSQQSPT